MLLCSLLRAATPQRRGGRGGGGCRRKSQQIEHDDAAPISEAHKRLLDLFTAVDHAYCFLVKNSISPRVSNIQVGVQVWCVCARARDVPAVQLR